MSDPDGGLTVGTIEISYTIESDGDVTTSVLFADFDVVPFVTQLGLLAIAKDTLLRLADAEDDDD